MTLDVKTHERKAKKRTSDVVQKIAQAMKHELSSGDLASLRRITPDQPYCAPLWRLLIGSIPDSWLEGPDFETKEARWACVVMGMSQAPELHNPTVRLGSALAQCGWSELRLIRLLRERDTALFQQVRLVASFLSSKGQCANWEDIAALVLNQEGDWAGRHRHRVARDYYRQLYSQETKQEN